MSIGYRIRHAGGFVGALWEFPIFGDKGQIQAYPWRRSYMGEIIVDWKDVEKVSDYYLKQLRKYYDVSRT